MAKKYYAVRNGRTVGIFDSWDDCKASIDGFSGAEYCSFKTKKEANAYLTGDTAVEQDGSSPLVFPDVKEGQVIAYVDGSFDINTGHYAFGCVLVPYGKEPEFLNGVGTNPDAASARNVAGELLGTMTALKWALQNGYRHLDIYHDYTGIQKWADREWKAESYVARRYVAYVDKYRGALTLAFHKVDAHTGVCLNEKADSLAKAALGIV